MPIWAITQRLETNRYGDRVDVLEQRYVEYFAPLVGALTPIPNLPDAPLPDVPFAGLILTGGGELPNRLLGANRLTEADDRLAEDKFLVQSRLYAQALAAGRPVVAVCYGLHLVNAFAGGRLTWNAHAGAADRKPGVSHAVRLAPSLPGAHPATVHVNTFHNQGIRSADLAPDLTVAALDEAHDLVEAAVHRSGRVLAVQWHPERPSPDETFNKRLLTAFLEKNK